MSFAENFANEILDDLDAAFGGSQNYDSYILLRAFEGHLMSGVAAIGIFHRFSFVLKLWRVMVDRYTQEHNLDWADHEILTNEGLQIISRYFAGTR